METVHSSSIFVNFYHIAWVHIPEDSGVQEYFCMQYLCIADKGSEMYHRTHIGDMHTSAWSIPFHSSPFSG
jgi:hypothetical protein